MGRQLLTLVLLLSATLGFGQSDYAKLIDYYHQAKNFHGAVLVATDGKIDFVRATGVADREHNIPMQADTKFKIASISKAFTAVLTMKLVEEGKLDIHKTIGEYLPSYSGEAKDKATIHHLLTYASGIENQAEPLGMQSYQIKLSLDGYIEKYCSGPLVSQPGTSSNYANTEYILLHKIIEQVAGMDYEQYLTAVILKPLRLENTGICYSHDIIPQLADAYTYNDSTQVTQRDQPYYPEMFFGAGGMYSTVADLLAFDDAVFNSKILNAKTTSQLLQINPDLGYTAYGFWGSDGWGTFAEKFYYRTGGILGATSNWIHTMDTQKTIIVMSNTNATNLYELSEQLYLMSIGKEVILPESPRRK